jgi:hypothetical protein
VAKQIHVGSMVIVRLHDGREVEAKVTKIVDSVTGRKAHVASGAFALIIDEVQISPVIFEVSPVVLSCSPVPSPTNESHACIASEAFGQPENQPEQRVLDPVPLLPAENLCSFGMTANGTP